MCIFREHVHKVIITVAQRSFTQPREPEEEQVEQRPRIRPDQVQVFIPEPQEQALTSRRFAITQQFTILRWFSSIIDPGAPIKMLSWFQLNALFEFQTGLAGIQYKSSSKRYFLIEGEARGNFVKRSNNFSRRWRQGIYGQNCRVLHLRPTSATLKFWTMCIPMPGSRWEALREGTLRGELEKLNLKVRWGRLRSPLKVPSKPSKLP